MEEVEHFFYFYGSLWIIHLHWWTWNLPYSFSLKVFIANLLEICIREFDENIYVVDTSKRFAQERSNVLQEEDNENISLEEKVCEEEDKILSLGMSMQPQEEDNEEQKYDENDEQLENEERKHPPSSPMDEGNTDRKSVV